MLKPSASMPPTSKTGKIDVVFKLRTLVDETQTLEKACDVALPQRNRRRLPADGVALFAERRQRYERSIRGSRGERIEHLVREWGRKESVVLGVEPQRRNG